jgi:hypothetical protein
LPEIRHSRKFQPQDDDPANQVGKDKGYLIWQREIISELVNGDVKSKNLKD